MMNKKLVMILMACVLFLTCAFDLIADIPVSEQTDPADTEQILNGTSPETGEIIDGWQDPSQGYTEPDPNTDFPPLEQPTEEPVWVEPTEEPVIPTEEPLPAWQGINEDQVGILLRLYDRMTDTGKLYSGWFTGADNAPCSWNGIKCEAGQVTSLEFRNAGFFTVFPDEILELRNLKELRMVDTMLSGPLPETLFKDLPRLEKLELKGNFLTGEIPALPDAFEFYPMLSEITISDNLPDDPRKTQLLGGYEYSGVAGFRPDPYDYPDVDLTPGLDGTLPEDWDRLPVLSKIDLSGNALRGEIPYSFSLLPLTALDLSDNAEIFECSGDIYTYWASLGNPDIVLDGIREPVIEVPPTEEPVWEVPTEEPVWETPTEEPVWEVPTDEPVLEWPTETPVWEAPTEEPVLEWPTEAPFGMMPTEAPIWEPVPTEEPVWVIPTEVPTQVPPTDAPTPEPIIIVVTATPDPAYQNPPTSEPVIIVVTATPKPRKPTATSAPRWYTATPEPYYYPPVYYYPTATPNTYYNPYWTYPTATPITYYNPYWTYPTATPNTYYNPYWTYPTATSVWSYPQVQPTATPVPTQDPASLLGFTYMLEAMTENNIPMTWRYTGMREYCITYLDASGNLYPAYAMEWTPANKVCNSSVCRANVSVPEPLLQGGKFSLQLRVRDNSGKTYVSDPVEMEVHLPAPTATPVPEQPQSFLGGFFHWLFGPIIRLFGGK